MSRAGVSSLLVVDGTGLCGLVTDRDLRNRVLAVGLDPGRPVREVMTGLVAGAGRGRALLVVQVRTGLDLFTGTPRVSRDGSKSPLEASCEIGLA